MKKWFRNLKLPAKMTLVYTVLAGVFCVFIFVSLQVGWNIYDEKLYEKSLQELDFFSRKITEKMEDTEELSVSIALNKEIQEQLGKMKQMEYMSVDYAMSLYHVRTLLMDEMNQRPLVENAIYLDNRIGEVKAGIDTGEFPEHYKRQLIQEIESAHGQAVYRNPKQEYPYFVTGRKILEVKNASLDDLGTLILTSDIRKIIEHENMSLEAEHAELYIYSDAGMIYQGGERSLEELPELKGSQGYLITHTGQKKYFMCYLKSSRNDWTFINFFPYSEIYGYISTIKIVLLSIFLILFLGILFAMQKLAKVITNPLEKLTDSMQVVELGDFKTAADMLAEEIGQDEVGILTQEFRTMLRKIDGLIYENYEKQLLLKDTNYKMLQAQINPHFLYNTLNTVTWMIKGKRNEEAIQVITELGKILRASFSKNQYVSVKEELEMVQGYATIQQYRYKNRAKFQIRESGSLEQYTMPKMVLQPLVENAIKYGVESTLNFCTIEIEVVEKSDEILMCVSDDGPGMSPEELESVKNGTMKPKGTGIGIQNIRERLRMSYEGSSFLIESGLGEGTRICITVPKKVREVQDV